MAVERGPDRRGVGQIEQEPHRPHTKVGLRVRLREGQQIVGIARHSEPLQQIDEPRLPTLRVQERLEGRNVFGIVQHFVAIEPRECLSANHIVVRSPGLRFAEGQPRQNRLLFRAAQKIERPQHAGQLGRRRVRRQQNRFQERGRLTRTRSPNEVSADFGAGQAALRRLSTRRPDRRPNRRQPRCPVLRDPSDPGRRVERRFRPKGSIGRALPRSVARSRSHDELEATDPERASSRFSRCPCECVALRSNAVIRKSASGSFAARADVFAAAAVDHRQQPQGPCPQRRIGGR